MKTTVQYPSHTQLEHTHSDAPINFQLPIDERLTGSDLNHPIGDFMTTQLDSLSVSTEQIASNPLEKDYGSMDWFFKCTTRHYFDFSSRAKRQEFWGFVFIALLISLFTTATDAIFGISALTYTVNIALLIPLLAVGTRRLHDIGLSGWWQLLYLTFFGALLLLLMWSLSSEKKENKYDRDL